jgi:hypothetical protein
VGEPLQTALYAQRGPYATLPTSSLLIPALYPRLLARHSAIGAMPAMQSIGRSIRQRPST